jgi:hypothetical protein
MVQNITISDDLKEKLLSFLQANKNADLVSAYLTYVQEKFSLSPVLLPKKKVIYRSSEEAIEAASEEAPLWREAEIKITFSKEDVNEQTKKIYICPFSGKVFGDNTHPNPQDAIYDWVSKCPENTERVGGLKAKRFYVSEDPEVIKKYLEKEKAPKPITKKVYSSVLNGKIFSSKDAVIEDFKKNYIRPMSLIEAQGQNRYQIEASFIEFIQNQLDEDKVAGFIEALADDERFVSYVQSWL